MTILDRLDTSRTRRRFWYPKPRSVWAHFRGPRQNKEASDEGEAQENEGKHLSFDSSSENNLIYRCVRR